MNRPHSKKFKNIILTGLPGVGKSTFARVYSVATKREFVDLDRYIKTLTGKSVEVLFAKDGEAAFRQAEDKAFRKMERRQNSVIATGGGTLCNIDNLKLAQSLGLVVLIKAPFEVLATRIFADIKSRPLFAKCEDEEAVKRKLQVLWDERKEFYEQADVVLNSSSGSMDNLSLELQGYERRHFSYNYQNDLEDVVSQAPQSQVPQI